MVNKQNISKHSELEYDGAKTFVSVQHELYLRDMHESRNRTAKAAWEGY